MRTRQDDPRLLRLSLNQRTIPSWSLPELVNGCARTGIGAVGLWREPVAEYGLTRTTHLIDDAGLRVSSLCRGGFLTRDDPAGWQLAIEDNLRALDEAAALRADCLVLVVGGIPAGTTDLDRSRQRIQEALAVLAAAAAERGVQLALEALHPVFCADRSVLCTLRQALQMAETAGPAVGVVVDAYHVWWDPEVWLSIAEAGPRILSYQVSDWILPLPSDVLLGRGMIGDGYINLRRMRAAVDAAGYTGDIEVEIFNQEIWDADPHQVLDTVTERYLKFVV